MLYTRRLTRTCCTRSPAKQLIALAPPSMRVSTTEIRLPSVDANIHNYITGHFFQGGDGQWVELDRLGGGFGTPIAKQTNKQTAMIGGGFGLPPEGDGWW
eukprot:3219082-Pyramimonas_sp.AAC.1